MRAEEIKGTIKLSVETLKTYKALEMGVVNWTNESDVLTTSRDEVRDFNSNWLKGFTDSNDGN